MNYLIITHSPESSDFASLLIQELRRFDIRATIFHNSGKLIQEFFEEESTFETKHKSSINSREFISIEIDLAIFIGDSFEQTMVNHAKRGGAKTCFLQLTSGFEHGKTIFHRASKSFDKTFIDLPICTEEISENLSGHYLTDKIRKHEFLEPETDQLSIGMLVRNRKNLSKLMNFAREYSKTRVCRWIFHSNLPDEATKSIVQSLNAVTYSNKLDALKHSNAVVVDSDVDSIASMLMNSPQVSMIGKYGLFGFKLVKKPLLNHLADTDIVKNFKPTEARAIQEELDRILNDHEYCASMLTSYQEVKEKIGTQPVARSIAQKLVDWIED